jgi:TolA-binding protein
VSFGQAAQAQPDKNQQPSAKSLPPEDLPPEEDEDVAPKVYPFNPIESDRCIRVGVFYMHQSKYKAAAGRFLDATKYNPNSAEAFFKLGEAEEKLKNTDAAKSAFTRVVQIAPDSKQGREAKKKLSKS